MILTGVPVIDIAPFREESSARQREVAATVSLACEDIGFFTVTGHGVPASLVAEMYEVSRAFFDLPLEEKLGARSPDPSRGYRPLGDESLSYSLGRQAPPDFKETLDVGPIDVPDEPYYRSAAAAPYFVPNVWPARPPALRAIWTRYYRAMEQLAATLMRVFAIALDLPETFFDDKIDRHITRMRAINYPDQPDGARQGQLRSGAHSDYGSLTILHFDDAPGGLQVRNGQGEWADVAPVPGGFVVNLGDLMANWTNDRWISTLHRVVNPPPDRALGSRRQSIVFFHQPNYDAVIECLPTCQRLHRGPKYPPITSGEHRRAKLAKTVMRAAAAAR